MSTRFSCDRLDHSAIPAVQNQPPIQPKNQTFCSRIRQNLYAVSYNGAKNGHRGTEGFRACDSPCARQYGRVKRHGVGRPWVQARDLQAQAAALRRGWPCHGSRPRASSTASHARGRRHDRRMGWSQGLQTASGLVTRAGPRGRHRSGIHGASQTRHAGSRGPGQSNNLKLVHDS